MLILKPHRSRQRSLHTSTSDVCSVWKFIVCTSLSSATKLCTSCSPSVWFASLNFRCHFRLNRRDLVCDLSLHICIPSFDWLSLSGMEDRPIELFYTLVIKLKRIYKRMFTQTLSTNIGPLILWFIRGNFHLMKWYIFHTTLHRNTHPSRRHALSSPLLGYHVHMNHVYPHPRSGKNPKVANKTNKQTKRI